MILPSLTKQCGRPLGVVVEWQAKPESGVYEYACHEGNYAMGNILRGARLLEKEWREQQATNTLSSPASD